MLNPSFSDVGEANEDEEEMRRRMGLRHRNPIILDDEQQKQTSREQCDGNTAKTEEGMETATKTMPTNVSATNSPSTSSELMLSWRRILLLIMAVTVHNFPEGLAVGVGFGSIGKTPAATFEKAFNLAIGIGLQNFPEGF
jgi:solute carrier family 39 (zinc transporter), member 11